MRNIQRALRDQKPSLAVALLRAAREVWPDGDNFGEAGAEPEEEFMALREVLFAELGVEEEDGGQGGGAAASKAAEKAETESSVFSLEEAPSSERIGAGVQCRYPYFCLTFVHCPLFVLLLSYFCLTFVPFLSSVPLLSRLCL